MKTRNLIKTILFAFVSTILTLSAVCKLNGRDTMTSLFGQLNMAEYVVRVGVIQLIIVACLLWKPLRSLGVLIGSAFLGGAIFMLIATDQSPLSAGLTLIALWIAYKLEWWGYWNHYSDTCGCGWCKRKGKHKERCDCKAGCNCEKGDCNC